MGVVAEPEGALDPLPPRHPPPGGFSPPSQSPRGTQLPPCYFSVTLTLPGVPFPQLPFSAFQKCLPSVEGLWESGGRIPEQQFAWKTTG